VTRDGLLCHVSAAQVPMGFQSTDPLVLVLALKLVSVPYVAGFATFSHHIPQLTVDELSGSLASKDR